MKKCESIKELILTDYIDGQLDKKSAESLESHLLECGDCRAFFKEVKINAVMAFQKAPQQPVPSELWDSIRQGIEQQAQKTNPFEDLMEKLKGLIVFPQMVPVFASVILMFLVGSVTLNTIHIRQVQAIDQGEYLVSLLGQPGTTAGQNSNDLGTPIESYFL